MRSLTCGSRHGKYKVLAQREAERSYLLHHQNKLIPFWSKALCNPKCKPRRCLCSRAGGFLTQIQQLLLIYRNTQSSSVFPSLCPSTITHRKHQPKPYLLQFQPKRFRNPCELWCRLKPSRNSSVQWHPAALGDWNKGWPLCHSLCHSHRNLQSTGHGRSLSYWHGFLQQLHR